MVEIAQDFSDLFGRGSIRPGRVLYMKFGGGPRSPIVQLCPARHPQPAFAISTEQCLAQGSVRLTESHGLQTAAIFAGNHRPDVPVPDNIRLDDSHRPGRDPGRWPAGAIGAALFNRLKKQGIYAARRKDGVNEQRALALCADDVRLQPRIEEVGQRLDLVCHDRKARRHGMAAASHQQAAVPGRHYGSAQVNAGDRAPGTFACTFIIEGDHYGRPAKFFLQPSRYDTDDARMPAVARHQCNGAVVLGSRQCFGGLLHGSLNGAAFFIEGIEFSGNGAGFHRVFRGEQPDAKIRFADPSPRIDARPECKTEVGADWRTLQPCSLDQRRHAHIAPLGHDLEALGHKSPVEAAQRSNVRHCAQRDEVEKVDEPWLRPSSEIASAPKFPEQGRAQQEGYAHGSQMPMRRAVLAFIQPVGIDQRMSNRERGGAFVVIHHDHIHSGAPRHVQCIKCLCAAIDGDDQRRAALSQPDKRLAARAIAFHQPVGNIGLRGKAEFTKQADEQGRTGRAVNIIVAEYRHLFPPLHRISHAYCRLVHVPEKAGIGHEGADGRVAVSGHIIPRAAACEQQLRYQIVGPEAWVPPVRPCAAPAPRLAKDGTGDIEREGHVPLLSGGRLAVQRLNVVVVPAFAGMTNRNKCLLTDLVTRINLPTFHKKYKLFSIGIPLRMSSVISVSGLSKSYATGTKALDHVDLDIRKGEIFALLGANGAGKTTLISIICGLVTASSGTVLVGGHDIIREYKTARQKIGLVPQEISLDMFESVLSTVNFSRGLFGKKSDPAYVEKVLRDLTLWDKRNAKSGELSGGMKRRLMIAKALVHEPEILFLDEPTAGVDVELRRDMWDLVRQMRMRGVTIILTTHYIEEAEEMADRVGVINKGRLILVEDKNTLMKKLGKKTLTVHLSEPLEALPGSLSDWDLRLSEDGMQMEYVFDAQADRTGISALLGRMGDLGIPYRDLNTRESSLEDIFVGLVRAPVKEDA